MSDGLLTRIANNVANTGAAFSTTGAQRAKRRETQEKGETSESSEQSPESRQAHLTGKTLNVSA